MSPENNCDICEFLWQYLIGILTIAITLVAVYTLYCYKKQKFCFRKSDNDKNNPNQVIRQDQLKPICNENIHEIDRTEAEGGTPKTHGRILGHSVIPCGFIDDTNFTDVDKTDSKNDSAPSPMTRSMPTQTSIKISTEIENPR